MEDIFVNYYSLLLLFLIFKIAHNLFFFSPNSSSDLFDWYCFLPRRTDPGAKQRKHHTNHGTG